MGFNISFGVATILRLQGWLNILKTAPPYVGDHPLSRNPSAANVVATAPGFRFFPTAESYGDDLGAAPEPICREANLR